MAVKGINIIGGLAKGALNALEMYFGYKLKEKAAEKLQEQEFTEQTIQKKGYEPVPKIPTRQAADWLRRREQYGVPGERPSAMLRGREYGPSPEKELANLTDIERDVYDLWEMKKKKAERDAAQKSKRGLVESGVVEPEGFEFEGVKYGEGGVKTSEEINKLRLREEQEKVGEKEKAKKILSAMKQAISEGESLDEIINDLTLLEVDYTKEPYKSFVDTIAPNLIMYQEQQKKKKKGGSIWETLGIPHPLGE